MANIYKVSVMSWNEVEERENEEVAFIKSNSFADAVNEVEEFYGECLTQINEVKVFDTEMVYVSPEVAKMIEKELF